MILFEARYKLPAGGHQAGQHRGHGSRRLGLGGAHDAAVKAVGEAWTRLAVHRTRDERRKGGQGFAAVNGSQDSSHCDTWVSGAVIRDVKPALCELIEGLLRRGVPLVRFPGDVFGPALGCTGRRRRTLASQIEAGQMALSKEHVPVPEIVAAAVRPLYVFAIKNMSGTSCAASVADSGKALGMLQCARVRQTIRQLVRQLLPSPLGLPPQSWC